MAASITAGQIDHSKPNGIFSLSTVSPSFVDVTSFTESAHQRQTNTTTHANHRFESDVGHVASRHGVTASSHRRHKLLPTTSTPPKTAVASTSCTVTDVRQSLVTFCAESSAHGLPHLVKHHVGGGGGGWSLLRCAWIVIFVGAMLGECAHLLLLTRQYLEYPSTDAFRVSQRQPQFPAITVCNADPLSELTWYTAKSPTFDHYYFWVGDNVASDWNDSYAFYNRINSAKGMFENINHNEIQAIGHQLEDLVMFCSYRGVACNYTRDFTRFESPTYFNCYKYHAPDDVTVDTGPDKGITFVLFLEGNPNSVDSQLWFTRDSQVEQTFGARMELHERGALPNPVLNGINIQPGRHTDLVLTQSRRKKLGPPNSECESRETLQQLEKYKYSAKGCLL